MKAPFGPDDDPRPIGRGLVVIGWGVALMGSLVLLSPLLGIPVVHRSTGPLDAWDSARLALLIAAGGAGLIWFGQWIQRPPRP